MKIAISLTLVSSRAKKGSRARPDKITCLKKVAVTWSFENAGKSGGPHGGIIVGSLGNFSHLFSTVHGAPVPAFFI